MSDDRPTFVRVTCPACEQPVPCPIEHVRIFCCREDASRNRVGFLCEVHGQMLNRLTLDGFYQLQMADVPVSYFTLAEVLAEQDAMIREFNDRLPDLLAQILDGAA